MKCPKCGFNSFEFLSNCKKCGSDLNSFKRNLGITPVVFTQENGAPPAKINPAMAPPVAASAQAAPSPAEDDADSFTWDTSPENEETAETSQGEDAFSGFELDFLKEESKPEAAETGFVFNEEPEAPDSVDPGALSLEDFSFFEQTLDPDDVSAAPAAGENDPFGESGVIGEIPLENFETPLPDTAGQPAGESYENEFLLEEVEEEEKPQPPKKETGGEPSSLTDFEKDFESIFQIDEETSSN